MEAAEWADRIVQRLPTSIAQRNAAISSIYAQLYLSRPDLFHWAGMAAFASFRIGMLLAVYDFCFERFEDTPPRDEINAIMDDADLITSIELLRVTNDEVFRSAGIAHIAYLASGYDPAAVGETLHPDWEDLPLERFFLELDEGREFLAAGLTEQAREIVREANRKLLRHEQHNTVERRFRHSPFKLGILMNLATTIDFDANHLRTDRRTFSRFMSFICLRKPWLLIQSISLPDMCNLAHRWAWIEGGVLPIWESLAESGQDTQQRLFRIARRSEGIDLRDLCADFYRNANGRI